MKRWAYSLNAAVVASLCVVAPSPVAADPGQPAVAAAGSTAGVIISLTDDRMEVTWSTLADISSVTSLYEGDSQKHVTVSGKSIKVRRASSARMFSIDTANGPYTIYVPQAAAATEFDPGIGYAYSPAATSIAWNASQWPDSTELLLDGVVIPVDSLGSAPLGSDLAGSAVQLRQPFSDEIVAFGARLAAAMPQMSTPEELAELTPADLLPFEAALLTAPSAGPEVVNTSLLAIVPTPEAYAAPEDYVACSDIPAGDDVGACPTEASTSDAPAVSLTASTTTAAAVTNVVKTRPVMKSFIPELLIEVPGGLCDNTKLGELFQGDNRGPGVDLPSARTTAYWDFVWSTNSASFLRRIGETVRLASIDRLGRVTGVEKASADINSIVGATGSHYLAGGTEGFRGVDLAVAAADPFCSALTSLAVNQDFGQTTATTFPHPSRPPFWEKDGSYATAFAHDAYPAHELYTYNYLPDARVVSGAPYFYTPPQNVFAPLCLAASPFCPKIRGSVTNP